GRMGTQKVCGILASKSYGVQSRFKVIRKVTPQKRRRVRFVDRKGGQMPVRVVQSKVKGRVANQGGQPGHRLACCSSLRSNRRVEVCRTMIKLRKQHWQALT